jgi:hypothetical protein
MMVAKVGSWPSEIQKAVSCKIEHDTIAQKMSHAELSAE